MSVEWCEPLFPPLFSIVSPQISHHDGSPQDGRQHQQLGLPAPKGRGEDALAVRAHRHLEADGGDSVFKLLTLLGRPSRRNAYLIFMRQLVRLVT